MEFIDYDFSKNWKIAICYIKIMNTTLLSVSSIHKLKFLETWNFYWCLKSILLQVVDLKTTFIALSHELIMANVYCSSTPHKPLKLPSVDLEKVRPVQSGGSPGNDFWNGYYQKKQRNAQITRLHIRG